MEAAMTTWRYWVGDHPHYYPLPPVLERDLAGCDLDAAPVAMDPADFRRALGAVLHVAAQSVQPFGQPAYHNGQHFVEVVGNTRLLLDALEQPVPEAVRQALLIAAAGHDFAHQGSTFRRDAPNGKPLPELGDDVATEQVSAILMYELARVYGFTPPARLFIVRAIHATTFGNPAISPQSPLEKLLACADVAPNTPQIVAWLKHGVDVTFGERPAKPAPTTFSGWVANRMGFIDYHLMNFVTPEKPQYVAAAVRLGWDAILRDHRASLQRVKDGTDPVLTAIMKAMLPDDRVDLGA